eukprot:6213289-Pleurochrysis_carterae.AAC.1
MSAWKAGGSGKERGDKQASKERQGGNGMARYQHITKSADFSQERPNAKKNLRANDVEASPFAGWLRQSPHRPACAPPRSRASRQTRCRCRLSAPRRPMEQRDAGTRVSVARNVLARVHA